MRVLAAAQGAERDLVADLGPEREQLTQERVVAGIELAPRPGQPGRRAYEALVRCFDAGALVRSTGDIIALSPPLTFERAHVDRLVDTLRTTLESID